MYRKKFKSLLFSFFIILTCNITAKAQQFDYYEIELDNPWLGLTAIKTSYPDITSDIFFDEEEKDWCIKIRSTNFYWAHGRLLQKKYLHKWKTWYPLISYYYETNPTNPKYYTKELIQRLKPKNIITERKNAKYPNYSFYKVVYQGSTKKQIIKQLREIKFLNKKIWVHKRLAQALRNVQKKIIIASKSDRATRLFLYRLGDCWGFNWRVISDSGKLSNHSWGTAIDIVPKGYKTKKIYWYWEAYKNEKWMLIPPEKRWAPPKKVVQAFQSEGFIWGGNWHVWDTMHFEYRPELLYISEFISSTENRKITRRKPLEKKKIDKKEEVKKTEFKGILIPIFDMIEKIYYITTVNEESLNQKTSAINFFREELEAEEKAMQEHEQSTEDTTVPKLENEVNQNITEDKND